MLRLQLICVFSTHLRAEESAFSIIEARATGSALALRTIAFTTTALRRSSSLLLGYRARVTGETLLQVVGFRTAQ